MKISYFHNAFDENKHDIKKTWSIIRQNTGSRKFKFCFYFSKIGKKNSQNVPHSDKNLQEFMPESIIDSMFIGTVEQSEVYATTNKLKSKLSHGHDDISTKLLKNTITNILQPITHIINLSFNTGVVPQEMKIANGGFTL